MLEAAVIVISYLAGSIPTAYIAGRLTRGIDIRKVGGGNMGALNTAREINPVAGLVVLLVDIAKGAGAILAAKYLDVSAIWVYAAGIIVIAGHCWPVFLKFKGGKGAATAIGVFLALAPIEFACCIPLMAAVILFTSNVTLGIAAGMLFFPLFLWIFGQPAEMFIFAGVVAVFLGLRYLPTAKRGLRKAGSARDFIIEKNFKPWQSRKKNRPQ